MISVRRSLQPTRVARGWPSGPISSELYSLLSISPSPDTYEDHHSRIRPRVVSELAVLGVISQYMDHLSDCSPRKSNMRSPKPKVFERGRHHSTITDVDTDHIRAWLNQIPAGSRYASPEAPHPKIDIGSVERLWHPHGLALPGISPKRHVARGATYEKSPDLLFPDRSLSSISSRQQDESQLASNHPITYSSHHQQEKRCRVPSELSVDPPEPPQHAFRKRPRRRTRHDRYETEKDTEEREEARYRSKRRNSRRKPALRSGREVMANFASDVVSNQRVTVSNGSQAPKT